MTRGSALGVEGGKEGGEHSDTETGPDTEAAGSSSVHGGERHPERATYKMSIARAFLPVQPP